MNPIVAVVGRPNVGKSTLFNRLTRTRQALVDDLPGVTRDRLYAQVEMDGRKLTLVDTGGFDPPADQPFAPEVHAQIAAALNEADAIIFLTDARAGLTPADQEVMGRLRRIAKPLLVAVNKVDSPTQEMEAEEFHALGAERLYFISAAHGHGVPDLMDDLWKLFPEQEDAPEEDPEDREVRVALLGRPNVGKSSLLNAILGQDRAVVSDVPGTTRDALDTALELNGRKYLLIDTAGVRRQGKIARGLEKAMVFRSLRAIQRAHVVAVLIDADQGVTDQDLRLVGEVVDAGRGLVVVINKWDLLQDDSYRRNELKRRLDEALKFAPWAPRVTMCAKTRWNTDQLLPTVDKIFAEYQTRVPTARLNQMLERILDQHQPPIVNKRRLKFYYATQASTRPPTVVMFVNDPTAVHFSYNRYLHNELRKALRLKYSPLRIVLRPRGGTRQGVRRGDGQAP